MAQLVRARHRAQGLPEVLPDLLGQVQQVARVLIRDQQQMQAGALVGEPVRGDGPVPGPEQDPLLGVVGEPIRAEQADARVVEAAHLRQLVGRPGVAEAVEGHNAIRR